MDEDTKNYECQILDSEDKTLKSCADIQIKDVLRHEELGRGNFGVIFPIIAKINGKKVKLAVKKIQINLHKDGRIINAKKEIHELYYEVENSYKMGHLGIGPIVYDAFYTRDANYINQYIIMEKMDISVRKWIESQAVNFTKHTCQSVTQEMLNLLHKQIFKYHMYCVDIKADNYLINFRPLKVRMIDFGEWCNMAKIPSIYKTLPYLKKYSREQHKEIFYALNALQLFLDIWSYLKYSQQNKKVCKWLLIPFYTDPLFDTYIINNELYGKSLEHKHLRQRSLKRKKEIGDMKQILWQILESGQDQGITLRHYLKDSDDQTNREIITSVYKRLSEIPKIID